MIFFFLMYGDEFCTIYSIQINKIIQCTNNNIPCIHHNNTTKTILEVEMFYVTQWVSGHRVNCSQ